MSNQAKFTPGPWTSRGTVVFIGTHGQIEEDGSPAYGGFDIVGCPRPEANAHLIAAAPELYEALDMLMDATGPGDASQILTEERENIMALLAKARGETQ